MSDKIEPMIEEKTGIDPSLKTAFLTAAFLLAGIGGYNFFFPDLSGMTVMEKCEYWAYWSKEGFDNSIHCKSEDASARLRGYRY